MTNDGPIVDEVRRRAMEISAEFKHDGRAYSEHIRKRQREERFRDRIVSQISIVPADSAAKPTR